MVEFYRFYRYFELMQVKRKYLELVPSDPRKTGGNRSFSGFLSQVCQIMSFSCCILTLRSHALHPLQSQIGCTPITPIMPMFPKIYLGTANMMVWYCMVWKMLLFAFTITNGYGSKLKTIGTTDVSIFWILTIQLLRYQLLTHTQMIIIAASSSLTNMSRSRKE